MLNTLHSSVNSLFRSPRVLREIQCIEGYDTKHDMIFLSIFNQKSYLVSLLSGEKRAAADFLSLSDLLWSCNATWHAVIVAIS